MSDPYGNPAQPGQPAYGQQPGQPAYGQQPPIPPAERGAHSINAWLGVFFWFVPIIFYFAQRDSVSPASRQTYTAWLNFSIVGLIVGFVAGVLTVVLIGYLVYLAWFVIAVINAARTTAATGEGRVPELLFAPAWIK